jgi:putative ABC transport system permease protein
VHDARTLADRLADTTADARYRAGMLAFFGVLALLLTATGLNAVTAGRVARRQRELAVHAALGATPGTLVRLVLRRTLGVLLVASAAGVGVALGTARWLASQFADVMSADLSTVSVAAATIVAMGTIAAVVPALRAARIDPNSILRAE